MMTNITLWNFKKPDNPIVGEAYMDSTSGYSFIWDGIRWNRLTTSPKLENLLPTEKQLETFPSLKEAWENYLIIKRLLGI